MENTMSFEYELQHGSYYLYDNSKKINSLSKQRDIILMCDEIAIVFDKENFTLHKHGSPDKVLQWYNTAREKFIKGGFPEVAEDLVMIQGAFPVEEINRCLSTSGYIEVLWKKLQANEVKSAKLGM